MNAPSETTHGFDQKKLEMHEVKDLGPEQQGKDSPNVSQAAKLEISPRTLIKEDLNQFKEGVKKMFKDKGSDPKPSQLAEKVNSPLTLLKEDFNSFKEELSSVFRIGPSRDRENKGTAEKEASRNRGRMKASRAERADPPLKSLFRREKHLLKTAQTNHTEEAKNSTAGLETNLKKQNKETVKSKKTTNNLNKSELSQLSGSGSEKTQTLTPTQHSETMFASKAATALQNSGAKHWQDVFSAVPELEDDKPLGKPLSSEFSLFPLRTNFIAQPKEDLWSVKNSAIYLTFDPNTANSELHLADDNRKVTRDWLNHQLGDHPERFEQCPQLLCREGLLDSAYWEVVWSGGVDIGVTYNNISRDGNTSSCLLGHNQRSWSLECSNGFYTPCHNNRRLRSSSPEPFTNRVGVYLNCSAGTLSFFCVSQKEMVHLHTFTSNFTEPLYPGFWLWASNGSVTLCHVELDWERLL